MECLPTMHRVLGLDPSTVLIGHIVKISLAFTFLTLLPEPCVEMHPLGLTTWLAVLCR